MSVFPKSWSSIRITYNSSSAIDFISKQINAWLSSINSRLENPISPPSSGSDDLFINQNKKNLDGSAWVDGLPSRLWGETSSWPLSQGVRHLGHARLSSSVRPKGSLFVYADINKNRRFICRSIQRSMTEPCFTSCLLRTGLLHCKLTGWWCWFGFE